MKKFLSPAKCSKLFKDPKSEFFRDSTVRCDRFQNRTTNDKLIIVLISISFVLQIIYGDTVGIL